MDSKTTKRHLEKCIQLTDIRKKLWSKDGTSGVSIMVGAGFSRNATKLDNTLNSMSLWSDLQRNLYEELGSLDKYNKLDALELGDIYEKELGSISLENILKSSIPDENYEPNILYDKLLQLPFKDIYTTNYDTLLERASKNIFNRRYQVIYDIYDIAGSVSPRIVKLHGSFPSHRPFVFTKKSYEEYTETSAPFVNMVQQSIMETTMILIGFSGDDPNFIKWISWVRSNLKRYRPKIYLIGLDIDKTKSIFSDNEISIIDLKEIFGIDNYFEFFDELFEFLNTNPTLDKRKWPYIRYPWVGLEDIKIETVLDMLKKNRESYPGWLIMPSKIANRKNMSNIVRSYNVFLTEENLKLKIKLSNEIVWILRKYGIPLDYEMQKLFEGIVSESINENRENEPEVINVMLFLLQEYRLDMDHKFEDTFEDVTKSEKSQEQKNEYNYQDILWKKDHLDQDKFKKVVEEWEIENNSLEYNLKKASLFLKMNSYDDARMIITEVLHSSRRIQSIDRENFFSLSAEGIALTLLQNLKRSNTEENYFNRLVELDQYFCNPLTTIESLSIFKQNKPETKVKEKVNFDGRTVIKKQIFSDGNQDTLNTVFFLSIVFENYHMGIIGAATENILEYLQVLYPLYTLKIFFIINSSKNIDNYFSRELIYNLEEDIKVELFQFLIRSLDRDRPDEKELELEVLFRLYGVLNKNQKNRCEKILFQLYKNYLDDEYIEVNKTRKLKNYFSIMFHSKIDADLMIFIEQVFKLPIKGEGKSLKELEKIGVKENFDPIEVFKDFDRIGNKKLIPYYSASKLLNYLSDRSQPVVVRLGAWKRLLFLFKVKYLSEEERVEFQGIIYELIDDQDIVISMYLKSYILVNVLEDVGVLKEYAIKKTDERIPESILNGTQYTGGNQLVNYLYEIDNLLDYSKYDSDLYGKIIKNLDIWWTSQYKWIKENRLLSDFMVNDLKLIVIFIKNTIFRKIPKNKFNNDMSKVLNSIFQALKSDDDLLHVLLIPGMLKLNFDDKIIEDLNNKLLSANTELVEATVNSIQDIALFKNKREITVNIRETKVLILNLFSVHKESCLESVSKVIGLILENDINFFTSREIKVIIEDVNRFYKLYLSGNGQNVFENTLLIKIIENFLNIVLMLKIKNKEIDTEQWITYSENSQYPEIYVYAYKLKVLVK